MIMKTAKSAAGEAVPANISRRTALGLLAAVAVPSAGTVAVAAVTPRKPTIDEFLERATLAERISYHSNELAAAMSERHPERLFITQIDHEGAFALVLGRTR